MSQHSRKQPSGWLVFVVALVVIATIVFIAGR